MHGVGEWGLISLIVLAVLASFALGRLSALVGTKPLISTGFVPQEASATMAIGGLVVASWSGSAYYYPWCGGADTIARPNRGWLEDEKAAQAAGYRPAKNCKGLTQ